ncbi:hypothetical protein BSPLISOX_355 [uncultured Gammaproteobacteria bacterium]|nr:hypothetical protein [uncultured Gammaproteobacteria bacterium]VVH67402.1 hypothetical protein BSPLISOX_355 [uncultured Gammaproteobacteria bacterium]
MQKITDSVKLVILLIIPTYAKVSIKPATNLFRQPIKI